MKSGGALRTSFSTSWPGMRICARRRQCEADTQGGFLKPPQQKTPRRGGGALLGLLQGGENCLAVGQEWDLACRRGAASDCARLFPITTVADRRIDGASVPPDSPKDEWRRLPPAALDGGTNMHCLCAPCASRSGCGGLLDSGTPSPLVNPDVLSVASLTASSAQPTAARSSASSRRSMVGTLVS